MKYFDLGIIYEHPEWHLPLFNALDKQKVNFVKIDLTKGAFNETSVPKAKVYYNLTSPSANLRGNQKAIPYANALCKKLEFENKRVLNGSSSLALEVSKSAQIFLLKSLGIDHPQSTVFNNVESLTELSSTLTFPMILKPEQGGSGSRIYLIHSLDELAQLLKDQPSLWEPDHLLILQEKLNYDLNFGIIRLEFLGDKLLYAMRIVTHGGFNLCPSTVCNPEDGESQCEIDLTKKKPEFYPYLEVPEEAIFQGRKIMKTAGHTTGSVEYVETINSRRVFYDINANSNLRPSVAAAFNIDPFNEVALFLKNISSQT